MDFLLGVLLLFQLEYVLVEVHLQILVGVVDAQLFETVFLKREKRRWAYGTANPSAGRRERFLTLKSSKPNMSRIDMAVVFFVPLYTIWLILATSHVNSELYNALANASLASSAWSMFSAVSTRSLRASCRTHAPYNGDYDRYGEHFYARRNDRVRTVVLVVSASLMPSTSSRSKCPVHLISASEPISTPSCPCFSCFRWK